MRNQYWLAAMVLMILVLSISACSRAAEPTPESTMTALPEPTAANTPTSPPTAAPQETEQPVETISSGGSAYPAPMIEYVPYNPYPDPIEGEKIEWSQLEALLQNEQISEVFQQYTLLVVITLDDGRIILVDAPVKDEIFKLLDACGERCNNIRRLSEF